MKPDKLFKNVERLQPPPTLEQSVMSRVRADTEKFPAKHNFMRIARQTLLRKSVVLSLATAAVLVIAIRLSHAPEPLPAPVTAQRQDDLGDFVDQTLRPVFGAAPSGVASDAQTKEDGIERFVSNQLDQIFWIINGGENA